MEADDVPVASVHGTNDGTVKYNRGIVNPGSPLMYLDGSRMIHERACALGLENQFYTFPNAPHVPYAGSTAYMDTTINFFRDFLIKQLGCTNSMLQLENARMQTVYLYPINYCDGSPVNEVCSTSSISEISMENIQVYPVPTSGELIIKVTDEGLFVHHDLTQEELAQLVGASRETVNKALADFAGRGWLKLDGRAVLITDVERLGKRGK